MAQYQICKNISNYNDSIKLDLNEFDHVHCDSVYDTIKKTSTSNKSITHYSNVFNSNTVNLIKLLSEKNSVDTNQILVSAGSDDSLEYIINKYVTKTTNVLVFVPSYNYFEIVIKRKTDNIHYIPIDFNIGSDLYVIDKCLEFYKDILSKDSLVYIVNPNNPLGTVFCKDSLHRCVERYPNSKFIIDEAYIEFSQNDTCTPILKDNLNVIVTRTFSKAYGLAGLRLGYLLAHKDTVNEIKTLYNEKNTTDIAKAAGIAVLENIQHYDFIINEIISTRESFQEFLQDLGVYHVKSKSNFVSFYVGKKSIAFLHKLEENNVFIRDRNSQIDMKGFLRVTIGRKENIEIVKNLIVDNIGMFSLGTGLLIQKYTPKALIWDLKLLLARVVDVLNNSVLRGGFWLDGGSLLGFDRHKGIIPWDDDVDLGINSNDKVHLLELEEHFQSRGLRLKLNRTGVYYQVDIIKDVSSNLVNPIHIDIFLFKDNGEGVLVNTDNRFQDNHSEKCNFLYNIKDLLPLRQVEFYNTVTVNVPNNHTKILDENIIGNYRSTAVVDSQEFEITSSFFA